MSRELPPPARKDFERAVALFNEGRLATAEGICADLIARFPLDPELTFFGGVLANRAGRFDVAVERLARSAQANPRGKAFAALGFAHDRLGHLQEAREAFTAAIRADPNLAEAHNGLGIVLVRSGDPAVALPHFDRALALRPALLEARLNAAQALLDLGRSAPAAAHFRHAATLAAGNDEVLEKCAAGLFEAGDLEAAERLLRALLSRNPADSQSHARLGLLLESAGREDEALAEVRAALAGPEPGAFALNASGVMELNRKRLREAEAQFRRALEVDPGSRDASLNLALVLRESGRHDEAREQMRRAEAGLDALGLARLALQCAEVGDSAECIALAERAIAGSAHLQFAHGTLAIELLRTGDTERGWREYLYRPSRGNEIQDAIIAGTYPPRLPPGLAGRDILVLVEQGLGDMLFFLRFAKPLADAGARLFLTPPEERLAPILERALDIKPWPRGRPVPPEMMTIWGGDLPLFVRPLTKSDTAPSLLAPPLADRVERMRERLGPPGLPWLGVAWRAGTAPSPSPGRKRLLWKDLPPRTLGECLAGLPLRVVSIQRNPVEGATRELEDALGASVVDCSAVNDDLEDMLALLSLLDGYAGVSSTNIHLRAMLGGTGRILVPFPPDWRWQSRGESAWFPGFATYRQSAGGDWSAALRGLREDLTTEAKA